jgi:hypothetical protein
MRDYWTPLQFDLAVNWFGLWIESKLNELDDKGKQKHRLKDLLAPYEKRPKLSAEAKVEALSSIRGAMAVTTGIKVRGASI